MTIFDSIKNVAKKVTTAVSSAYGSADKAVGGYLPGGQTPSQVSDSKVPSTTAGIPSGPNQNFTPVPNTSTPSGPVYTPSTSIKSGVSRPSGTSITTPISVPPTTTSTPLPSVPVAVQPGQPSISPRTTDVVPSTTAVKNKQESYISQYGTFQYPLLSVDGQRERIRNVGEVVNAAFNPFTRDKVQANTDVNVVDKSLELIGNHPYQTAALFVTAAQAYKVAYSAISSANALGTRILAGETVADVATVAAASGEVAAPTAAGVAVVNTATTATKVGILANIAKLAKNPAFVMGAIATYAYSVQYAKNPEGDAIQSLQIAMTAAQKAGDVDGYNELKDYYDDLTNPTLWDKIEGYVPVLNVLAGEAKKVEASRIAVNVQDKEFQIAISKAKANQELEDKINRGQASNAEIAAYAKENPYSIIAKNWADSQTNVDANGESIFGKIDESGNYVPSATERAKAEWERDFKNVDALGNPLYGYVNENGVYVPSYTEQAKRLEAQQYYNGLQGGQSSTTSSGKSEFQPPSTLTFGLLKTPGGYETADKSSVVPEGSQFVTDVDEISNYYFGVPYGRLTPAQKQLVDLMK